MPAFGYDPRNPRRWVNKVIGFCPLASGSKGNCIYFGTRHTKILIDAGLSAKMITERLAEIHVDIQTIDAVVVTHEHTDHIKGLPILASRNGIPIFANSDTAKAIASFCVEMPKFKIFSTGEIFEFGDIQFHPFSIQHDAIDPVGFTLKWEGMKFGFCADLGCVTTLVKQQLQGCDYLYVEANHQVSMVHACSRSSVYKQRVLSRLGHLSNDECAHLLTEIAHPRLKHVHLAHLSSECNAPALALELIQNKLKEKGHTVEMSVAYQDKISRAFSFS